MRLTVRRSTFISVVLILGLALALLVSLPSASAAPSNGRGVGVAASVLFENFDAVTPPNLPPNWSQTRVVDPLEKAEWYTADPTVLPPDGEPHSWPISAYSQPYFVVFNSYNAPENTSARMEVSLGNKLASTSTASLSFWLYHYATTSLKDTVQVQISTNGCGPTAPWTGVLPEGIKANGGANRGEWMKHDVALDAYTGGSNVCLGFLGTSGWGNDMLIDDVQVTSGSGSGGANKVYLPLVVR